MGIAKSARTNGSSKTRSFSMKIGDKKVKAWAFVSMTQ
jgi:hypothetical protein